MLLIKRWITLSLFLLGCASPLGATKCDHLLNTLATQQKELLSCVTTNSVPVTVCIACKGHYDDTLQVYKNLVETCSELFFDKDRINMIASVESALTGLWSKAFCDDCFNNDNLATFVHKNKTFYDCAVDPKDVICAKCKVQYLDLNNFYINLDQHNNGKVCYDLQDSMNRTRDKWSKELKCCRREKNLTLFAIVLSIISCLPLVFYSSAYLLTKRQERNHGVINDEDPIYNSQLPSTSRQLGGINNSAEPITANYPSSSNADINNINASTTLSATDKKVSISKKANEDAEDSDDDSQINITVNHKQLNIFK